MNVVMHKYTFSFIILVYRATGFVAFQIMCIILCTLASVDPSCPLLTFSLVLFSPYLAPLCHMCLHCQIQVPYKRKCVIFIFLSQVTLLNMRLWFYLLSCKWHNFILLHGWLKLSCTFWIFVVVLFVRSFFCWDKISLYSSCWPKMHSTGLEFTL